MQVESIAECSKGCILQYFRPSLSYLLSIRSLLYLYLHGRFTQVLLYWNIPPFLQDPWPSVLLLHVKHNAPSQWNLAVDQIRPALVAQWHGHCSDRSEISSQMICKVKKTTGENLALGPWPQFERERSLPFYWHMEHFTGFAQAWKVLEFRGLSWKVLKN